MFTKKDIEEVTADDVRASIARQEADKAKLDVVLGNRKERRRAKALARRKTQPGKRRR